jgi:DNA-binding protein HU-beta
MSDKIPFSLLVDQLANETGLDYKQCHSFVSELIDLAADVTLDEGKFSITNFGSFSLTDVAEREGVHPKTGEPITIAAHQRMSFSPFKALENSVNEPFAHLEATKITDSEQTEEQNSSTVEPQKLNDSPVFRRPGKKKKNNTALIIALAVVIVAGIAISSIFYFGNASNDAPQTAANEVVPERPVTVEQKNIATETTTAQPENTTEKVPESKDDSSAEETAPPPTMTAQVPNREPVAVSQPPASANTQEVKTASTQEDEIRSIVEVNRQDWMYEIARDTYGRTTLWPLIFAENYPTSRDPDFIRTGPEIIIPAIEGTAYELTVADSAMLSRAYQHVSDAYKITGKNAKSDEYALMSEIFRPDGE